LKFAKSKNIKKKFIKKLIVEKGLIYLQGKSENTVAGRRWEK